MPDRERIIKKLEVRIISDTDKGYKTIEIPVNEAEDILAMLKEQESLLGIQQTADGITFISTGTAQQGEERGILLGKSLMHEWIYKELLHKELLTDDIRSALEQAKRI